MIMQLYIAARLMRLDKPVGIFLLLWPTLCALWIGGQQQPSIKIVVIFILGVVVMRSAGCVINDIADRHFDKYVARTKNRPLASGETTLKNAFILLALLLLVALFLVLQLNKFTIKLSLVGLLLAAIYPWMKRITHWPQVVLGAAFAWAIPMAFSAQTNNLPIICWILYVATLIWSVIYDTEYALVDQDDDKKIGIKSTAILFGRYTVLIVGLLQLIMIGLFISLGISLHYSFVYFASLTIASAMFIYQLYLIHTEIPTHCFKAFLNNQWVGMIIFLGVLFSSV